MAGFILDFGGVVKGSLKSSGGRQLSFGRNYDHRVTIE